MSAPYSNFRLHHKQQITNLLLNAGYFDLSANFDNHRTASFCTLFGINRDKKLRSGKQVDNKFVLESSK